MKVIGRYGLFKFVISLISRFIMTSMVGISSLSFVSPSRPKVVKSLIVNPIDVSNVTRSSGRFLRSSNICLAVKARCRKSLSQFLTKFLT